MDGEGLPRVPVPPLTQLPTQPPTQPPAARRRPKDLKDSSAAGSAKDQTELTAMEVWGFGRDDGLKCQIPDVFPMHHILWYLYIYIYVYLIIWNADVHRCLELLWVIFEGHICWFYCPGHERTDSNWCGNEIHSNPQEKEYKDESCTPQSLHVRVKIVDVCFCIFGRDGGKLPWLQEHLKCAALQSHRWNLGDQTSHLFPPKLKHDETC